MWFVGNFGLSAFLDVCLLLVPMGRAAVSLSQMYRARQGVMFQILVAAVGFVLGLRVCCLATSATLSGRVGMVAFGDMD